MPRVRRAPDEAKRLILDAAADLLRTGGPGAVQVRAVAARLEITDAAVNHHFGTRDQLLAALLRDAGSRIKGRVQDITAGWGEDADVGALVDALADAYADGYGELGLALHQSGWRDSGSGMLTAVVDELHRRAVTAARRRRRTQPPRQTVEIAVAALHQALATDPSFGHDFRRSAGYLGPRTRGANLTRAFWTTTLQTLIDG